MPLFEGVGTFQSPGFKEIQVIVDITTPSSCTLVIDKSQVSVFRVNHDPEDSSVFVGIPQSAPVRYCHPWNTPVETGLEVVLERNVH